MNANWNRRFVRIANTNRLKRCGKVESQFVEVAQQLADEFE